ncbi:MAG: hypothetical protein AB7S50_14210 [Bacteroidales bacterium]
MIYRIANYILWSLLMLILFSLVIMFALFAYYFYKPEINLFGYQITNSYHSLITSYPVWIYLIVCFTALSILFVFIFLSLSLYYSFVREKRAQFRFKYSQLFTTFLTKLFLSESYKTDEQKIAFYKKNKRYFKTRIQLIAFIDTYLRIQELLAVNLSDDFKSLIQLFNLQHKIESFLYHRQIDDRILSMKILSYLHINTHNHLIIKYGQSKNIALRTEAYAALIRLMESGEHLVNFIGEKHSLSLLDFNIIVNAVLKNNNLSIDYRALLASKQSRKNMIGLILAKYKFRKNRNNLTLIINHLYSSDEYQKQLAWDALLTVVPEEDAVDIVIDEFEKQNDEIKLTILKNSQSITNQKFIYFLSSIITKQTLLVKIEIMRIIYKYRFGLLSSFENSDNNEIGMAYNEISNIYLSS